MSFDSIDWNMWCMIATAAAAIIALFQSNKQTKLSNKHKLFDRRLNAYYSIKELLRGFSQYKHDMIHDGEPRINGILRIPEHYKSLCSNNFLFGIFSFNRSHIHSEKEKEFSDTCVKLNKLAIEIQLIFEKEASVLVSNFIEEYGKTLTAIFVYYFVVNEEEPTDSGIEKEYRIKVIKAIQSLDTAYNKIVDNCAEEELLKQIRFFKKVEQDEQIG